MSDLSEAQRRILERVTEGVWPVERPGDWRQTWWWRRGPILEGEDPPHGGSVRALVEQGYLERYPGAVEHLYARPEGQ